jgi:hypothetical protein
LYKKSKPTIKNLKSNYKVSTIVMQKKYQESTGMEAGNVAKKHLRGANPAA